MRQNAAFGLRGTAHGRIRSSESGPGPTRSNLIHWPLHARPGVSPIRLDEPEGPTFRMAARHWLCPGVLPETAAASDGAGVPRFIECEFRDFLGCGILARGFAHVRCDACQFERLLPFSFKARAVCPSCGGRRMAEQAAHLVEAVLPTVPVRQWVLTVPHRLRYRLAFDHALCRAVLGVFIRAVLSWYRRRGRRAGVPDGQSGTVTVVQRFGSGLELNVHFHALGLDGVFAPGADGTLRFHRLPPPATPTSPGWWRRSRGGSSGCSCAAGSSTTPTPWT